MDEYFVVLSSAVIIIAAISFIVYLLNKINFRRTKPNEVIYYRGYLGGDYGSTEKHRRTNLHKLILKFKKETTISDNVSISSKFNNLHYPVFDLDNQKDYDFFKELYVANSYVIFRSSKEFDDEHYWAIVDSPQKDIKNILQDKNWKICNDSNYVRFSTHQKKMFIRGLYKNLVRKPIQIDIHGKISKNLKLFIDKVITYYNKEGLVLSVLKHKDPTMLIRYNRKIKLRILNETKES